MKLIKQEYQKLFPTESLLSSEVVVAQAWKKTHSYMRTHNWYADTLALDVSCLSLEANIQTWRKSIVENNERTFPVDLIPAAKSEAWVVDSQKGWTPKALLSNEGIQERKTNPPIRPLAHLTIRDQTWATAAMMCLADIVETKQGDCSCTNYFEAQNNKVYSYGNRLNCDWREDGKAWFRWGNSQVYRRFFSDYQSFLKRPVEIGKAISDGMGEANRFFVISLDISKFYDNIDTDLLVTRLQENIHKQNEHSTSGFWASLNKILSWNWSEKSQKKAKELGISLSKGLPQGLVASGFFANAYMLQFDSYLGSRISLQIPGLKGTVLHDYCRYVDDIRLVVSVEEEHQYAQLAAAINTWVGRILSEKAGKQLQINPKKTRITSLADLDNKGSLSGRIEHLQQEISGPADRDTLENCMGVLEGLLSISPDALPSLKESSLDADLIRIARFDHDVKTDTLKRFAANRLETVIRNKRKIEIPSSESKDHSLENESELLAKKLIWAWMQDPSLALVLRKAFEIFPSPDIAEPVFKTVFARCGFNSESTSNPVSSAMFEYLLADLFRCCVDFYANFQREEYSELSDPEGFLELACFYAQKTNAIKDVPQFVQQQALLLLAVKQKPAILPPFPETIHQKLHALLAGQPISWQKPVLALYEVASQITGAPGTFSTHLLNAAEQINLSIDDQEKLLTELAKRGGPFWNSIWTKLPKSKINKKCLEKLKWSAPLGISMPKRRRQKLSNLISSKDNAFVHETAFLKLGLALIDFAEAEEANLPLSPYELELKQKGSYVDWKELYRPTVGIEFTSNIFHLPNSDPRFSFPEWLLDDADAKKIYWIGNILRAAAVGAIDFTGNRWRESQVKSYKGLRTGWYKRRMGMMHAPEALVGEFSTLSSWAAELLMACLQWPGFESTNIHNKEIIGIESIDELRTLLTKRLSELNSLYCKQTDIPTLITPVGRPRCHHESGFRLVSVQQLLPRTRSFTESDPTLSLPAERAKNRDHLARICKITYRTLQAKLEAEGKSSYPGADLIIFPEVAIHPRDQDLLKRLADKTKSMIFAGLTFMEHDGKLINVARWFIPDYKYSGRQWTIRDQGKGNPTQAEIPLGVEGYRPCQHIIEIQGDEEGPYRISGAICYDSTDLKLAADLKGKTDLFIISAHNKDVRTFDAMATALNYHMYQHVAVVNKGEFGGSTIQAPYKEQYDRLISHAHGTDQISINIADLDLAAFRRKSLSYRKVKTPPAGKKSSN